MGGIIHDVKLRLIIAPLVARPNSMIPAMRIADAIEIVTSVEPGGVTRHPRNDNRRGAKTCIAIFWFLAATALGAFLKRFELSTFSLEAATGQNEQTPDFRG